MTFLSLQQQGSDSDISLAGDHRSSKKDLKERISGMFKRSGSSSRAGSQEKMLNDSQQRPISIASNGSSTLPANFSMQQSQVTSPAAPAKVNTNFGFESKFNFLPSPQGKPPTPTSQRKLRPSSTPSLRPKT